MPKQTTKTQQIPSLRDLVDAGAQFGHRRSRTYPTSRQYAYGLRDRVYVIDLEKTRDRLEVAAKAVTELAQQGKTFLFVGTKPQAAATVKQIAEQLGQPYIVHRWLGGMLTNFETLHKSLQKIERYTTLMTTDQFEEFTKQEQSRIRKELARLERNFGGLRKLNRLPDALVIVDIHEENIAVAEARALSLPIIAIVDTNSNPDLVTYPIPANDDSRKTIELILKVVAEAIELGRASAPAVQPGAAPAEPETEVAEETETPEPKAKKPAAKPRRTAAKKKASSNE